MVLRLQYIRLPYLKWTETLCVYFEGSVKIHSIAHALCQIRKWPRTKHLTWSAICPSCLWVLSLLSLPTVSMDSSTDMCRNDFWSLGPTVSLIRCRLLSNTACWYQCHLCVCVDTLRLPSFLQAPFFFLPKGTLALTELFSVYIFSYQCPVREEKNLIAETSIVIFYATESLL